ncbi:hypothetical protein [Streptomyces liangshanensis]|uniref:Lipoprotein n=1 Tax=Streptomyces liangshanensis TaxID=2717324 RepID=A0A6G9H4E7_9ACTN|nr:hypothetical protein [Streptomyces liangshanensis]QIQ05395.1 hypothetical protein HA039_26655 [Streptomyces liangshanensis]
MERRARAVVTGSALFALSLLGAGCTPGPKGVLAVERTADGEVGLLVAECPGYQARIFSVLADDEGEALLSWAVFNLSRTKSLGGVRLFAPAPEGWETDRDNLKKLAEGVPYVAKVDGSVRERGLDGRVAFTLDDLDGVKKGQVLIADGDGAKAVDREDFLRPDSDRCEP